MALPCVAFSVGKIIFRSDKSDAAVIPVSVRLTTISADAIVVNLSLSGTAQTRSGMSQNISVAATNITIPAGSLTGTTNLTIINNGLAELDKTFYVTIAAADPTKARTFTSNKIRITIVDDVRGDLIDVTTANSFDPSLTNLDPTGVVDCTAAIETMIAYLKSHNGGILYFPAGTYKVEQIDFYPSTTKKISFIGPVSGGAKLIKTFTSPPLSSAYHRMFYTAQTYSSANDSAIITFQNLELYHLGCVGSFEHMDGILISASDSTEGKARASISNCSFYNFLSYAISAYDNADVQVLDCYFENVWRGAITSTGGFVKLDVQNCEFENCAYDFEFENENSSGYGGSRQMIMTIADLTTTGGFKLGVTSIDSSIVCDNVVFSMGHGHGPRTMTGYGKASHEYNNCDIYAVPYLATGRSFTMSSPGAADFNNCNFYACDDKVPNNGYYVKFSNMAHTLAKLALGQVLADGSGKVFVITSVPIIQAGTVRVFDCLESEIFTETYSGSGILVGSAGGSGTVNYTTGTVEVTFNTAPVVNSEVYISYKFIPVAHPTTRGIVYTDSYQPITPNYQPLDNWSKTGWTVASHIATHTVGSTNALSYSITGLAGADYVMKFTMTCTAGSVTPGILGGTGAALNTSGTKYVKITTTGATGTVSFTPTADFAGTISDVSVTTGGQRVTFTDCNFDIDPSAIDRIYRIGIYYGTGTLTNGCIDNKVIVDGGVMSADLTHGIYGGSDNPGGIFELTGDLEAHCGILLVPGSNIYRGSIVKVGANVVFDGTTQLYWGGSEGVGYDNAANSIDFSNSLAQADNNLKFWYSPVSYIFTNGRTIVGTATPSVSHIPHGLPGDRYEYDGNAWVMGAGHYCFFNLKTGANVGSYTYWELEI